jgi:hypothetical protein
MKWFIPVISALKRFRQQDLKFKANQAIWQDTVSKYRKKKKKCLRKT